MAVVVKRIKPRRLQVAAMRRELEIGMTRSGEKGKGYYEKITDPWEHKVVFEILTDFGEGLLTVLVDTNDMIFTWVDKGTKGPYPIFAGIYTGKSNKRALHFPGTFTAKTIPGVLSSGPGFKGPPMVTRPYVNHPGIKPRNFTPTIEDKWSKDFKDEMEAAMKRARDVSGNAI